jgi:hypothetical protein
VLAVCLFKDSVEWVTGAGAGTGSSARVGVGVGGVFQDVPDGWSVVGAVERGRAILSLQDRTEGLIRGLLPIVYRVGTLAVLAYGRLYTVSLPDSPMSSPRFICAPWNGGVLVLVGSESGCNPAQVYRVVPIYRSETGESGGGRAAGAAGGVSADAGADIGTRAGGSVSVDGGVADRPEWRVEPVVLDLNCNLDSLCIGGTGGACLAYNTSTEHCA